MSNLVVEGFDWFPTGKNVAERTRIWAANSFYQWNAASGLCADVAVGRFAYGQCLAITNMSTFIFYGREAGYVIPLGNNPQTGFYGVSVRTLADNLSGDAPCLGFFDGVEDDFQFCITFEDNGVVKAWKGPKTDGIQIGVSKIGVFQEDQWFHVEIKGEIDDTAGNIEVRINTVAVLSLVNVSNQKTINSYFDAVFVGVYQGGFPRTIVGMFFDDLFVNDTTGSINNDWLGNNRVKSQWVIGNGAHNDFTIGGTNPAATNWQSVLNNSIDDTRYVYTPTLNDYDLYQIDPNLNAALAHVVQVRSGLRQDDATQRAAKHLLHISGIDYLGNVEHFTNQTFTFYRTRWEVNPSNGAGWTGTQINGVQVGVKVTV